MKLVFALLMMILLWSCSPTRQLTDSTRTDRTVVKDSTTIKAGAELDTVIHYVHMPCPEQPATLGDHAASAKQHPQISPAPASLQRFRIDKAGVTGYIILNPDNTLQVFLRCPDCPERRIVTERLVKDSLGTVADKPPERPCPEPSEPWLSWWQVLGVGIAVGFSLRYIARLWPLISKLIFKV